MTSPATAKRRDHLAGLVVVGIGNELRRDDGIGVAAARALAGSLGELGARVVLVHQLAPELAADLVGARAVIFVDAAVDLEPGTVRVATAAAGAVTGVATHQVAPEALIDLCAALYGARPVATVVSVGAGDLGVGGGLSSAARQGCERAGDIVRALAEEMIVDA